MSTTTKTPALLTTEAEEEVQSALLHAALGGHQGAVEHDDILPPVGPEQVLYRLGALEVEELSWSPGGVKATQEVTVWAPGGARPTGAALGLLQHVTLGDTGRTAKRATLSDGTTVSTGVYSVEVFPHLPLLPERTEQVARVALGDRHRGREVGKVHPVEGKPEHRTQKVEVGVVVVGSVRPLMDELRGSTTAAGHVSGVEVIASRPDHIGSGSFATATPSRDRNAVQLGVTVEWRER